MYNTQKNLVPIDQQIVSSVTTKHVQRSDYPSKSEGPSKNSFSRNFNLVRIDLFKTRTKDKSDLSYVRKHCKSAFFFRVYRQRHRRMHYYFVERSINHSMCLKMMMLVIARKANGYQ